MAAGDGMVLRGVSAILLICSRPCKDVVAVLGTVQNNVFLFSPRMTFSGWNPAWNQATNSSLLNYESLVCLFLGVFFLFVLFA